MLLSQHYVDNFRRLPWRSAPGEPAPDAGTEEGGRGRSPEQTRVLDALSARSPRSVEAVAQRSGLSLASTQSVLGGLELDGSVELRERGWVRSS